MKVDFARSYLVVVMTLGCNAGCLHCLYGCSPQKMKLRMSRGEISGILREGKEAGMQSVCFTGGEPFVMADDLLKSAREAEDLEYSVISVRTNGFWAADDRMAEKTVIALQSCGVNQLGVSCGEFQGAFVPLDNVKRIVKAAEQMGLDLWLDWVGTERGKVAWEQLGEYMRLVRGNPSLPCRIGKAKSLPDSLFRWYNLEQIEFDSPFSFTCGDPNNLYLLVYPGGYAHLHSCCLPNPRLFKRFDLGDGGFGRFAEDIERDEAVEFLYRYGVGGLVRKARQEHPELLKQYYSSSCEACWELLGALFPLEQIDTKLLFGSNGQKPAQLCVMADRLIRKLDKVCGEYVKETKDGYSLMPHFEEALK